MRIIPHIGVLLILTGQSLAASPNFVIILADDQPWNGTSVPMIKGNADSKSRLAETPNIERLAAQGMVFSQAYAPHSKCEPTRYSLQWGRTPVSLNAPDKFTARTGLRAENSDALVNTLKRANPNYRAAFYGKWQLVRSAEQLGFDDSDGRTDNNDGESKDPDDPKQMFSLTKRGNAFMEKQVKANKPFALILAHYAVHTSLQSLPATLKKYQQKRQGGRPRDAEMAACTEDLDTCVGLTLKKIEQLGIADNTFVIYMSDNGGRTNYMRGGKTTMYEGGLRVPLIVRGPGVAAKTYCNIPVVGYDLFPTMLDFATPSETRQLPDDIEGGSWREILTNAGKGTVKRNIDRFVFHYSPPNTDRGIRPHSSIRVNDHKLIHYWGKDEVELFDLSNDLTEQNNIAKKHPDIARALQKQLLDHVRAGIGDETFAQYQKGDVPADGPRGNRRSDQGKTSGKQRGPRDPSSFDTNKDGKVSRAEAKRMPTERFDRLDRNRDGFLDKTEMSNVRSPGNRPKRKK